MVEPPAVKPPERGLYGRPSRQRVILRRIVAVTVLVGGFVLLALLAAAALRGSDTKEAKPVRTLPPPPPKPFRIVFPEGFTRKQMAERVAAVDRIAKRKRGVEPRLSSTAYLAASAPARVPAGFVASKGKPASLEGFLFPATYDFLAKTTSSQLVNQQLRAFLRTWSRVNLHYARSKQLSPYDVLIIASMIEKEVTVPAERPLVAAVIYNRLKAGIPLGIDATIRYALDIPPTQSIRVSQLQNPTPYNTRRRPGLPPTPIGNPGLASMQAAAHPARTNYLYFVRKPDKRHHFFTASYRDFQNYARAHGY